MLNQLLFPNSTKAVFLPSSHHAQVNAAVELLLKLQDRAQDPQAVAREISTLLLQEARAQVEAERISESLATLERLCKLQPEEAEVRQEILKIFQERAQKFEDQEKYTQAAEVYQQQYQLGLEKEKAADSIRRLYGLAVRL